MRSFWILNATFVIAAVGCSLPGSQKTAQLSTANKTSWTDKVTAPLAALTPDKKSKPDASSTAVDPISLNFESGPPTPALYVSMAQISDQGGNIPHARAMYQKALSIDRNNIDALLGLARLEDREGNLQAAIQHYQHAVKKHPKDARPLNDLGLCYARAGQMQASLECLDKAVRLNPEKQLYRNNIAKVLIELNQFDSAIAHLGAVYEPAVANYNLAALLNERGRGEEAIPFLQRALAAKPDMAQAATLLASISGTPPAVPQMATGRENMALRSPIAVSQPLATVNPLVTGPMGMSATTPNSTAALAYSASPVANSMAASAPETSTSAQTVAYSYPTTGAPPMIPVPAQTARVPVGYEPALLPPIR